MRVAATIAAIAITLPVAVFALPQNPPGGPPRDVAAKPPTGTAIISGIVVSDDATPAPMRRVRVTARSDAYGNGWSATTDDDGRFVIGNLPAGKYAVQASKPAWLIANYGAVRPGRPGTPIAIADGQKLENVRLQLSRGSVITGTVLDRSGDPLPAVTVSAMKYVYSELTGERVLARTGEALTDDQGAYRCFGLTPGDYVIVATLRSGPATALMDLRRITAEEVAQAVASAKPGAPTPTPPPTPANQGRPTLVGYAPVYFPSTVDVARATTVKLGTSEEKGGLNITIDVVPTARVDAVPNLPETANRQSLQVYLIAQQSLMAGASGMTTGRRDAEGRVVFNGITPGNYTVIARAAVTGAPLAPAPAPAAGRGASSAQPPLTLYASADLTVDGRDLVVPLDLKPGMTVSGRIAFDNPDRAPKGEAINVSLLPLKSGPALTVPPGRVDADGTFRLVGVPPGRYRLDHSAGRALDDWSLVSATVKGREVLDASIEIRASEDLSDLILRFTDKPSELAGKLQTSSGSPATAYSIIVFSAAREFWLPLSRRVRSLRPATDGGFSVRGLPAGEYYIAALTDIEPGEWYDPAFLAQLIATSAKVVVKDGAKTVQDLMIR